MVSQLYPYQERAVEFIKQRGGRAGLFMEMGTGKSRCALTFCEREGLKNILIVCPLSVTGVWENEIRKLKLDVLFFNACTGSIKSRQQMIDYFYRDMQKELKKPLYIIINYESYWRMPLRGTLQKWKPDIIILDEAHRIKSRTTRQAKFAHTLAQTTTRRLALTGTPITNGLHDLFSMYKFIDPTVFGTRWSGFEDRFIKYGGYSNYEIVGYKDVDTINQKVKATAFQISKEEALDLPPRVDIVVPIKLEPATQKQYDEFKKNAVATMHGTDEQGKPLTGIALARIVLTSILRLQQITSGFVATEDNQIIYTSSEKVKACDDLVEDALANNQQVVVFCRFVKDIERLSAVLRQSATIHGSIPQKEREARIQAFQRGDIKVLICQIQVASLGIDLTASNIGIFFSTGFSLTDFLQSRDRIHRHGQTRKVTYYHLIAERSVDEKVYQALQDKVNIASQVVRLDYASTLFR